MESKEQSQKQASAEFGPDLTIPEVNYILDRLKSLQSENPNLSGDHLKGIADRALRLSASYRLGKGGVTFEDAFGAAVIEFRNKHPLIELLATLQHGEVASLDEY